MPLAPGSLKISAYQIWTAGNPPQPDGERVDLWALDDQGNVVHKWWDGTVSKWSGWENLGHP